MQRELSAILAPVAMAAGCTLALLLAYLLAAEWRPGAIAATAVLPAKRSSGRPKASSAAEMASDHPERPSRLSLLTWNIGYAGLDASADFFLDGGTGIRPASRALVERNLHAQAEYLRQRPADLVLLQEVDRNSTRSFGTDQAGVLSSVLPQHERARALNLRIPWIPYPILHPLGRFESGMLSLSRFPMTAAWRRQLPGAFPWPQRVFYPKRCLHEIRFPAPDGHDWVVIGLHLTTFDRGGRIRLREMACVRELLLELHRRGDHVIVGGDWNQALPGVDERLFPSTAPTPSWFQTVPPDWTPPGWRWALDRAVPSLRATDRPYAPGFNFLTILDGFLVGPGIEIVSVETDDLQFAHSDHQPVRCEVTLPG